MHGKKRAEYKAKLRDPKTAAILSQKAEQWHQLVGTLAQRRPKEDDSPEDLKSSKQTMALLEKALLVNPDPLYLWNHRREWILKTLDQESTLATELALTQAALERNPKAYGAWMQRKWIIQQVQPDQKVLQTEVALTAQFLKLDERNFHCWNYRRFIVAALSNSWTGLWKEPVMGVQVVGSRNEGEIPLFLVQSEWKFTQTKIEENFSNFSAVHYRSQLLPRMLAQEEDPLQLWQQELQLMENAICTEPDDQTAWWYHALLLDSPIFPHQQLKDRLLEQVELFRELLVEEEGNSSNKWILLGLHKVFVTLQMEEAEQADILKRLMTVDPDRAQRYQQLFQKLQIAE